MRRRRGEIGFTLLETICVLAIIAMLAAIALSAFPRGTSRAMLEAYAMDTAALLKADRNAAIRRGAAGRLLQLPQDVGFNAILASQCDQRAAGMAIQFLPSGMSCGGTIYLSRLGTTLEVRVTWLTGGVEIVPSNVF
jgi:general secretion pathway protein H